MIEEATIVLTSASLLSSIWSPTSVGPGVDIDTTPEEWEIVRVRLVDDGIVEIDIKRKKGLRSEKESDIHNPLIAVFQGEEFRVDQYTLVRGREGSITTRDPQIQNRISINSVINWIGCSWAVVDTFYPKTDTLFLRLAPISLSPI